MTILNQVKQMREQGLNDEQIVQQLKEQGNRAMEINQAIEQSEIKAAVSQDNQLTEKMQTQEISETGAIQPSVTDQEQMQELSYEQYEQPPEENPEYMYPAPEARQAYSGEYSEYQPYQSYSPGTAETTTEIAEQVAEEKISRLKAEIGNIQELKISTERRIKNIGERLKRIEEIIDRLQATIIGKVGSYGQTAEDIKKEMKIMQESFSKALPSLAEKKERHHKKAEKPKNKPKSGIEHYLRR